MAPSEKDRRPFRAGRMAGVRRVAAVLTERKSRPKAQSKPRERTHFRGGNSMNKAVRWRILSLQAMMVVILAASSGFLFYEGSFVTDMIKTQLTAQQVYFPTADQIKTGGALDPAEVPQEIRDQAGFFFNDTATTEIYTNDFLGKHLQ